MKVLKQEKEILSELFKSSNGLFPFTLHRQLRLSPKELYTSIEHLKVNGLIEVIEDRVTLTKEGISFSVKNTLKSKVGGINQNFFKEDYLGRKLEINEFYIPQNFEE
ncbi:MAG: hypothetical protein LAT81_13800 [Oceanicaulis sp.]|nr:hypothetical protein [Oceanicaulis sp.]